MSRLLNMEYIDTVASTLNRYYNNKANDHLESARFHYCYKLILLIENVCNIMILAILCIPL